METCLVKNESMVVGGHILGSTYLTYPALQNCPSSKESPFPFHIKQMVAIDIYCKK